MKRFAVLVGILLAAAPASAQITDRGWTPGRSAPTLSGIARTTDWSTARDVGDIFEQIDRGRDAGTLSRREARGLRRSAHLIGRVAARYARDGLTDSERRDLMLQTGALRDRVNLQRLRGAGR